MESLILDPSVATGEDISLSELVPRPCAPLSLPIIHPAACVVCDLGQCLRGMTRSHSFVRALLPLRSLLCTVQIGE